MAMGIFIRTPVVQIRPLSIACSSNSCSIRSRFGPRNIMWMDSDSTPFAHLPAPIPRCSCLVLLLLASQTDGGLRLIRTGSAVTLPVSRLARRSIFILAGVLADPATAEPFTPEASCSAVTSSSRPVTSGWSSSCRVGYLPPTGRARSFHGALGI